MKIVQLVGSSSGASTSLEGEIEAQLQDELFQQWLEAQVDDMTVEMEVTEWLSL